MMDKLLPCPFCGGEAVPTQEDCLGYYNDNWMVFCEACDLYIGFAKQYTKEEAIAAWNRRAQPENKPLTCEGCESQGKYENEVEYGYPSPCTRCARRAIDNHRYKPEEV